MKQIKTFKEYIEFTKTTAVYPKDKALEYLTFGMIDEMFEYMEKVEYGMTEQIVDELSDVCWYVAQLCNLLDVDINEEDALREYHIDIYYVDSYITDANGDDNVKDILQRMGKMCGHIKKYIRDDNEEKMKLFRHELLMIVNRLQHLATQSGGYNLQNVLQINVNKLTDRAERNVLKGDGDNR